MRNVPLVCTFIIEQYIMWNDLYLGAYVSKIFFHMNFGSFHSTRIIMWDSILPPLFFSVIDLITNIWILNHVCWLALAIR